MGSIWWWEDPLCRSLADAERFVIRYDHRDTGQSVTYEPGRPGYTGADMVVDAVGVLDGYGVRKHTWSASQLAGRSRSSSHWTSPTAFSLSC